MITVKVVDPPLIEPVSLAELKLHLRISPSFIDDDAALSSLITLAREQCEMIIGKKFYNQTLNLTLDYFPTYQCINPVNPSQRQNWPLAYQPNLTIALPYTGLVSIIDIGYTDQLGNGASVPVEQYYLDKYSDPARIIPLANTCWPYSTFYTPGSVNILYIAGAFVKQFYETFTIPATAPYTYTPLQPIVTSVQGIADGVGNITPYFFANGLLSFDEAHAGAEVTVTYYASTLPLSIKQAILLLCGHFYEQRNQTTQGSLSEIPWGIDALLSPYKSTIFDISAVV